MTATGFLHPAAPPAPRPAGYPADYASCTALQLVHGTVQLYLTVRTVCVDKAQAKRLAEDLRSHRNDRQVYSLMADAAAIA